MEFRAQVYCSIGLLGLQRRGCPRAIASIDLGLYVLLYFHELNRSDVECSSLILLFSGAYCVKACARNYFSYRFTLGFTRSYSVACRPNRSPIGGRPLSISRYIWPVLTPSLCHTLSHIPGPPKYVTHLGARAF